MDAERSEKGTPTGDPHACVTCGTPLVYPQRSCSRDCALASYGVTPNVGFGAAANVLAEAPLRRIIDRGSND